MGLLLLALGEAVPHPVESHPYPCAGQYSLELGCVVQPREEEGGLPAPCEAPPLQEVEAPALDRPAQGVVVPRDGQGRVDGL